MENIPRPVPSNQEADQAHNRGPVPIYHYLVQGPTNDGEEEQRSPVMNPVQMPFQRFVTLDIEQMRDWLPIGLRSTQDIGIWRKAWILHD